MIYENHNRNFETKDESSILKELLVSESVKSNTIKNNEKLISFLHKPLLKETSVNQPGLVKFLLFLGPILFIALFIGPFAPFSLFLFIITFSTLMSAIISLIQYNSSRKENKETLDSLTKEVLQELEYKNLVKEILEEYDEILKLPIVSDENENIIIKVTSIIDSLFNLNYCSDSFSIWELNRKYIKKIKEDSREAVELGKHILDCLLFDNIDNTYT